MCHKHLESIQLFIIVFIGLGQLVSNPGSPSRLIAASQSPAFPIIPLGAPGPSIVPQVAGIPAAMARLQLAQQPQTIEKTRTCKHQVEASNLFLKFLRNYRFSPWLFSLSS